MISLHPIVLGSQSPRRQNLLKDLGLEFTIRTTNAEEIFPDHLKREEIVEFLAKQKAELIDSSEEEILITSDTIVWINDGLLGKPTSRDHAIEMISKLSNQKHEVLTGVCIQKGSDFHVFHDITEVYFRELSQEEIVYYVDKYKPFDKAGSYGIQEWIGYVGIKKIEGDFFNVMGLPVFKLYDELIRLRLIQLS